MMETANWQTSLYLADTPSFLLLIFVKSSMNPMAENAVSVHRKSRSRRLLRSPQRSVARMMLATTSSPPMLGVLSFEWSTYFSSTTPSRRGGATAFFSRRTVSGPSRMPSSVAVTSAAAARKVK